MCKVREFAEHSTTLGVVESSSKHQVPRTTRPDFAGPRLGRLGVKRLALCARNNSTRGGLRFFPLHFTTRSFFLDRQRWCRLQSPLRPAARSSNTLLPRHFGAVLWYCTLSHYYVPLSFNTCSGRGLPICHPPVLSLPCRCRGSPDSRICAVPWPDQLFFFLCVDGFVPQCRGRTRAPGLDSTTPETTLGYPHAKFAGPRAS